MVKLNRRRATHCSGYQETKVLSQFWTDNSHSSLHLFHHVTLTLFDEEPEYAVDPVAEHNRDRVERRGEEAVPPRDVQRVDHGLSEIRLRAERQAGLDRRSIVLEHQNLSKIRTVSNEAWTNDVGN